MKLIHQAEKQMTVNQPPRGEGQIVESESGHAQGNRGEQLIALALCAAVLAAGVVQRLIPEGPAYAESFAPLWISIVAAVSAAAGIIRLNDRSRLLRVQRVLIWGGLLLMVWTANGLPFDLLHLTPLMPPGVDWPGLVTRMLALAAVIVLVRLSLAPPFAPASPRPANWYGYAAFLLALPYPVLRVCWALGGTQGLKYPGAAGQGFAPLLIAIPWILAAALSLMLVSERPRIPRRLLLTAGWSATAIVGMIGPATCWSVVSKLITDGNLGASDIATWVFCLFYGSWFLWAIAAFAATRSYQMRSSGSTFTVRK